MSDTANIVTGPHRPGPCPEHPYCLRRRCARLWCPHLIHIQLRNPGPGQPRRFCSTRCRVAEHRRLHN